MNTNEEKIFCGSGKAIWDGKLIKLNICLSDIPKEFIRDYNGKKFVNLDLFQNKNPGKNTHHLVVNTWNPLNQNRNRNDKPSQQTQMIETQSPIPNESPIVNDEDILPF